MYSRPFDKFVAFLEVLIIIFIPVFAYDEASKLVKV
jgi:hypothetical protein